MRGPAHYTFRDPQPIEVIERWGLNWRTGNVVKYLGRAPYKGDYLGDLQKALWYLVREIKTQTDFQGRPSKMIDAVIDAMEGIEDDSQGL